MRAATTKDNGVDEGQWRSQGEERDQEKGHGIGKGRGKPGPYHAEPCLGLRHTTSGSGLVCLGVQAQRGPHPLLVVLPLGLEPDQGVPVHDHFHGDGSRRREARLRG